MLLRQSRVTPRLQPPEDARSRARGHHLQASHQGRQSPLHGLYPPQGTPKAIPDFRPEGGCHPMGQAVRNRCPDRALPTQPGSVETDLGGPDRPLHRACPSGPSRHRKGLRPASPLVEGPARVYYLSDTSPRLIDDCKQKLLREPGPKGSAATRLPTTSDNPQRRVHLWHEPCRQLGHSAARCCLKAPIPE